MNDENSHTKDCLTKGVTAPAYFTQSARWPCEKGWIHTGHWNDNGLIRLAGEARFVRVGEHEATKHIPKTLPRTPDHMREFVDACQGFISPKPL